MSTWQAEASRDAAERPGGYAATPLQRWPLPARPHQRHRMQRIDLHAHVQRHTTSTQSEHPGPPAAPTTSTHQRERLPLVRVEEGAAGGAIQRVLQDKPQHHSHQHHEQRLRQVPHDQQRGLVGPLVVSGRRHIGGRWRVRGGWRRRVEPRSEGLAG